MGSGIGLAPIALSDHQLETVMTAANPVPVERRGIFLERVGAMLRMRGYGHFTDADVAEVARLAKAGLIQQPAALIWLRLV
jgi:hypothetical protein